MAKNELLPFADGEDANVLPTAQWEALTDILENGFQSGIAKSEQVNRVLAQGAVASYVLGQLIVDQLNKDAKLDKDTLYQNLILALQENAKDACLPLSGGTMTGDITLGNGVYIKNSVATGWTRINGGTSMDTGARIQIAGKSCSGFEGQVWVVANDGTNSCSLKLSPDGTATWGNKNVLTEATAHIVETWSNGAQWYHKYSDGRMMQGGCATFNFTSNSATITFPSAFGATDYSFLFSYNNTIDGHLYRTSDKLSASIKVILANSSGQTALISWLAIGRWK